MKKITTFENKKVLVLGLAKSGMAAARLLFKLGALVTVNDFKAFDENPEAQELLEEGIKVVTGGHPVELLDEDFELMVKNPGIRYDNPMVVRAQELGLSVLTEIELAYLVSEAPIIGITGTNGKTTTTTLIGALLKAGGQSPQLAGNIGFPASTVVTTAHRTDTIVMETSSFQLMGIDQFHPKIAVITNIYSTHLDYHGTQANYEAAKWNLQKNMTSDDVLILNFNQDKMKDYAKKTNASVLAFSTREVTDGAYVLDGEIYFKNQHLMATKALSLPGEHNIENALAAICVAKRCGVSNDKIISVLTTFEGVRHRLQYLGLAKGRRAYNDTEATNIEATKKALTGFDHQKLWLFIGGLDRGNGFEALEASIKDVKGLVISGETTPKLVAIAKKYDIPYLVSDYVEDGMEKVFPLTKEGDTLLLSPACASWGQYTRAEERGDRFIAAFEKMK